MNALNGLVKSVLASAKSMCIDDHYAIHLFDAFERISAQECGISKRAFLLFAIHMDPSVSYYYQSGCSPFKDDALLVSSLATSAFPLLMPRFIDSMGQNPSDLVIGCMILIDMWDGSIIGTPKA